MKKTAAKFYDNDELFKKKLEKVDQNVKLNFEFNKKLIDFNKIPKEYVNEFTQTIIDKLLI